MSLNIAPSRKVTLKLRGLENNPFVSGENLVSGAGVVLSSNVGVATDGALANAANGGTYDFWTPTQGAGTQARYIVDFGSAKTFNFVGIAAHNIGTLGGINVWPQYSNDNVAWINVPIQKSPTDNRNLAFYFEDVTARYVRIIFNYLTVGEVMSVGVVNISKVLTFPTRIYQGYTPPLQATRVDLQSNVTEGNNYIGSSVVRGGMSASASFSLLADDFVRGDDFQAFQSRFNAAKPFFWAWRPLKYDDLLYAWRSGSPIIPSNTGPKAYMGFDMSMRAYDDKS